MQRSAVLICVVVLLGFQSACVSSKVKLTGYATPEAREVEGIVLVIGNFEVGRERRLVEDALAESDELFVASFRWNTIEEAQAAYPGAAILQVTFEEIVVLESYYTLKLFTYPEMELLWYADATLRLVDLTDRDWLRDAWKAVGKKVATSLRGTRIIATL